MLACREARHPDDVSPVSRHRPHPSRCRFEWFGGDRLPVDRHGLERPPVASWEHPASCCSTRSGYGSATPFREPRLRIDPPASGSTIETSGRAMAGLSHHCHRISSFEDERGRPRPTRRASGVFRPSRRRGGRRRPTRFGSASASSPRLVPPRGTAFENRSSCRLNHHGSGPWAS